jgi:hypothetical protein
VPQLEFLEDRLVPTILLVFNPANSGPGTLRDEIAASVNHTTDVLGRTGTGDDTIQFNAATLDGQTISLTTCPDQTTTLTVGQTTLTVDLTVDGPSAFHIYKSDTLVIDGETGLTRGVTIARDPGAKPFRLFDVDASASLHLKGLTLSGGDAQGGDGGLGTGGGGGGAGLGGAIFNQGTLTILDSTLTGNTAQGGAGGLGFNANGPGGGGGGLGGAGGVSRIIFPPLYAPPTR